MIEDQQPTRIYASRWKMFIAMLGFAGGTVVGLLYYFVWPTPTIAVNPWQYQEPGKTLVFLAILLFCGLFLVLAVYWMITPRPLLQMDKSSIVQNRFPLPSRTIYWADVYDITAAKTMHSVNLNTITTFCLWFSIKPSRVVAYGGKHEMEIKINKGTLAIPFEEVVRLIRRYHTVRWFQPERKARRRRSK